MRFKYILKELKKGVGETSKYILSHHEKEDYYKCYLLKIKNRHVAFCSRCLGIYLGILLGILVLNFQILDKNFSYLIISFFPLFALIDWSISAFTKSKSNNFIRTSSGVFLGIAYAFGFFLFFKTFPNYFILSIGFFYAIIAFLLIKIKRGLR